MGEIIDDSLYSRQRYVLGDEGMLRLQKSSVAIIGLGGMGVEIAKNVILSGCHRVTLIEWEPGTRKCLEENFFLTSDDIGINRAVICEKHLKELNPGVGVDSLVLESAPDSWEGIANFSIRNYGCVVFTQGSHALLKETNSICHSHNIPVPQEHSPEALKEFCTRNHGFLKTGYPSGCHAYEKACLKGVVRSANYEAHGLQDGDVVALKNISNCLELDHAKSRIKVIDPFSFLLSDLDFGGVYDGGGAAVQVKEAQTIVQKPLDSSFFDHSILTDPINFDYEHQLNLHIAMMTSLQHPGHSEKDWMDQTQALFNQMKPVIPSELNINPDILSRAFHQSSSVFPPLFSVVGGFASQEVLKALTGRFMPLNQMQYFDHLSIGSLDGKRDFTCSQTHLEAALGPANFERLRNLKLFLVGCGAIGCELLKVFQLLGLSTGPNGHITLTDNDLIEKSNLNRQFLFRPKHVNRSKSAVATERILKMRPDMKITPLELKVSKETEETTFTDEFFGNVDIVVNALDNVEARIYMDGRCVTNGKPLFESGTMGPKGHTQIILPFLTESYASHRDAPDNQVPMCTLKSFPSKIEHTIQWARNKFEAQFSEKPEAFNNFWRGRKDISHLLDELEAGEEPEGARSAVKILKMQPTCWQDCVRIGRLKFEKYFNHKAKQLLHTFPPDHRISDGTKFWRSPSRPAPVPVIFSADTPEHLMFVSSYAELIRQIFKISLPQDRDVKQILESVEIPSFSPKQKAIATEDEESQNPNASDTQDDGSERDRLIQFLKTITETEIPELASVKFEKDDNGHIDFVASTSNLRAIMYGLEPVDRYRTKRIAGNIIPAIATTTACVAGLVAGEIVRWALHSEGKDPRELDPDQFQNAFLNLALPSLLLSSPGRVEKRKILKNFEQTLWDKLVVKGHSDYTLMEFMKDLEKKFSCAVTMVAKDRKLIYIDFMPAHKSRLKKKMTDLLGLEIDQKYVDLMVSMSDEDLPDEDDSYADVRYFI